MFEIPGRLIVNDDQTNDYGRPEFVTKLSKWRPEIFFYQKAEIDSFQVFLVDFPKLPLKMAIKIKLFK